jgi:hypothetical protein
MQTYTRSSKGSSEGNQSQSEKRQAYKPMAQLLRNLITYSSLCLSRYKNNLIGLWLYDMSYMVEVIIFGGKGSPRRCKNEVESRQGAI